MNISYRLYTPADEARCIDIISHNFENDKDIIDRAAFELSITGTMGITHYVAEVSGLVVGWAGVAPSMILSGVWNFIWINVDHEWHKLGIGTDLVQLRVSHVKRNGGKIILLTTKSPDFFKELGFTSIDLLGDGWVLMRMHT